MSIKDLKNFRVCLRAVILRIQVCHTCKISANCVRGWIELRHGLRTYSDMVCKNKKSYIEVINMFFSPDHLFLKLIMSEHTVVFDVLQIDHTGLGLARSGARLRSILHFQVKLFSHNLNIYRIFLPFINIIMHCLEYLQIDSACVAY